MVPKLPRPDEPAEAPRGPVAVRAAGKQKRLGTRSQKNIRAWTLFQALKRRKKRS